MLFECLDGFGIGDVLCVCMCVCVYVCVCVMAWYR